jgi:hypothetical protein
LAELDLEIYGGFIKIKTKKNSLAPGGEKQCETGLRATELCATYSQWEMGSNTK